MMTPESKPTPASVFEAWANALPATGAPMTEAALKAAFQELGAAVSRVEGTPPARGSRAAS